MHARTHLRPLYAVPGDAPPQHVTFDPLTKRVHVASGESGTLRTLRLADARLLRTRRVTIGSYNICALDGRVITPSLDNGRLTLLDALGLRSARVARARPRRLHRRGAPNDGGLHRSHDVERALNAM